jgi:hypothetical protein
MDTEIGNPIEYNPQVVNEEPLRDEQEQQQYYYPPPHMMVPPQVSQETPKPDIFANLDKTAYLVIFAAFILGFFMGKTMQPVILRHG